MLRKETVNRTKEFSLDAIDIAGGGKAQSALVQAILTHGMLVNEGLHAIADSIDKRRHIEVAADTIAKAIELLES